MITAKLEAITRRPSGTRRAAKVLFVITTFAGSFLLFLVEPLIARMALPLVGGAPAVWNSALLVYQALLLAGYAYAHGLGRLSPARQALVHCGLLALAAATLPIGLLHVEPPVHANAFLWVPWLLTISIGPLFLVISAQAPLMQRWYAVTGERDPYPLYVASNVGSFSGLLLYPIVLEPLMPIDEQRWLWSGGYVVLGLLVACCARYQRAASPHLSPEPPPLAAPSAREMARWMVLAAVPSGLVLATTLHLTTDVAAMPLLWVIPLGLYLLSFTIAFSAKRRLADVIASISPLTLIGAASLAFFQSASFWLISGALALLNLFAVSVALHAQLFDRRPHPTRLTVYYLVLALGGVLGGIFCALLAPLMFDWGYENPALLLAAAALLNARSPLGRIADLWTGDWTSRTFTVLGIATVVTVCVASTGLLPVDGPELSAAAAFPVVLTIAVIAIGNRALLVTSLAGLMFIAGGRERLALSTTPGALTRSYFGIYTVEPAPDHARRLIHGTTLHGLQNLGSPTRQRLATTYYASRSGVGLALAAAPKLFGTHARIDIVGLGAGTVACYARPGERWTFYEIDPAVARIARDPNRFTFLSLCLPTVPVLLGDARLTLDRAAPAGADLLVVDAFSSDAIPVHLLTRQAFAIYRRRLSSGGLLLLHITNRFVDLEPVIAAEAAHDGWQTAELNFAPTPAGQRLGEGGSRWIAMSRSTTTLQQLVDLGGNWTPVRTMRRVQWTDDYASVLPLLRWHL